MLNIKEMMLGSSESDYKDFTRGLVPTGKTILGVRTPRIKQLAKQVLAECSAEEIIVSVDDSVYEEIMLCGFVIAYDRRPIMSKTKIIESFVRGIDNWAICDSFAAALKVRKDEIQKVRVWLNGFLDSHVEFEKRFGLVMLLDYFVTAEHIGDVLSVCARAVETDYYIAMAAAWLLAECYIKQPALTEAFFENNATLPKFTYNKAIQKICESYRVLPDDKVKLRALRRA